MSFENPVGNWSHDGAFSITLHPKAQSYLFPEEVARIGCDGTILFFGADLHKDEHGFVINFDDKSRRWNEDEVMNVRDAAGNLLWLHGALMRASA